MSDKTTKTTRKPEPRPPNDADKQRERKRALDRKAQRASREKTKSHIAHLEHMVKILGGDNRGSSTSELMEEITRLNGEIDRLRKIIDSIKSILGVENIEAFAPRSVIPRSVRLYIADNAQAADSKAIASNVL